MATGESRPLAQHLERLWNSGTVSGLSDAELVRRFTSSVGPAAEQAFEALLGRHGPMVLGVCRHILRRPQDVDDAFQATFLVLVRKARSIRVDESLGPWLYGVAYRTAIRARSKAARHHLEEMNDLEAAAADPAGGAFAWEIRPMLHEELNRLPEKYRSPIVLCHLEGKSHEEAARMLDWPVGTLSGRLSRGRQLLKDRLQRRGLTASAGMLAARFPGEAHPGTAASPRRTHDQGRAWLRRGPNRFHLGPDTDSRSLERHAHPQSQESRPDPRLGRRRDRRVRFSSRLGARHPRCRRRSRSAAASGDKANHRTCLSTSVPAQNPGAPPNQLAGQPPFGQMQAIRSSQELSEHGRPPRSHPRFPFAVHPHGRITRWQGIRRDEHRGWERRLEAL